MPFLDHDSASNIQWQLYRRLELIPPSLPDFPGSHPWFGSGLSWVWHAFIRLLLAELEAEGRLKEYCERCWLLDMTSMDATDRNRLHQLWVLMD